MLTQADLDGRKLFFNTLGNAIKKRWKKTSPQKRPEHADLRVVLSATHESGQLQNMPMTKADELFIKQLAVYSDSGEDPARSLQRFIDRFKKKL